MSALVEFADVAFSYAKPAARRTRVFAFGGLSFAIERGEIFGVIGPNSAGKTSLLRRLNREGGLTILLVSHDLNLAAEVCDRLLLLRGGAIARVGAPADVLEQALLEDVFGCHVVVDKSPSGRPSVQLAYERR